MCVWEEWKKKYAQNGRIRVKAAETEHPRAIEGINTVLPIKIPTADSQELDFKGKPQKQPRNDFLAFAKQSGDPTSFDIFQGFQIRESCEICVGNRHGKT